MVPGFPWFGPKRVGWGWRPVTWQGWLVTIVFVVSIITVANGPSFRLKPAAVIGLVAGLFIVVAATGTKPGGNWRLR